MKINRISCQNFFIHKNTTLDFTKHDLPILLTGSNGSGKSSAVSEALSYVLFGETRLSNIDDAIRTDQDFMSVTIEFELNGQSIEITRSKKLSKSQKLQLIIDGEDVSELLSETQKHIERLIPLSYNAFRSSVILRQEDDFFISQKPDERKKIIAEILSLDEYERLEKLAKDQRAEIKLMIKAEQNLLGGLSEENVDELRSNLGKVEEHLGKFDDKIELAESKLNHVLAFNSDLEKSRAQHSAAIAKNRKLEESIANHRNSMVAKKQQIKIIENSVLLDKTDDIKALEDRISKLTDDASNAYNDGEKYKLEFDQLVKHDAENFRNETLEPLQSKMAIVKQAIEESTQNLNKAKAAGLECDSCGRPFEDATDREKYILSIEEELLKSKSISAKFESKLSKALEEYKSLKNGDYEEAISLKTRISDLQNKYGKASKELADLRKVLKDMEAEQHTYLMTKNNLLNLKNDIILLLDMIDDLSNQIEHIDALAWPEPMDPSMHQDKLNKLRQAEKDCFKLKTELEQQIKNGVINNERRSNLIDSINIKLKRQGLLDKLCIAFSRKGVPAAIIETVLPEIQDIANQYLSKMSEDKLEIYFQTTEKLKNGETKDTLEIEVFDGITWRPLETFSGGEKFRVSLSIRLALSRILANKANIELKTIILDEPGGSLDSNGRELLVSTIKSLSSFFSRTIIMSHLDLTEDFNDRISIEKAKK
jgi:exonuclease SbcC